MKIYYFSSSHWDREWYQTFQQFRYYLVAMGQNLLDCLESNPEFKVFNFDGQSVVLEDILEIKPEWRKRFEKLIEADRLNIGPWYVQPDEFLVSGEALIHNLLIGHELAKAFGGKAWKAGYLCDIFGHIAQMPQILRGFDIDSAVVWRGIPEVADPYVDWQSPDGSKVTMVKLPLHQGYGDFAGQVVGFWDKLLPEQEFKDKARKYIDKLIENNGEQPVLLMDGVDHAPVHSAAPQYIKWLKELYPAAEVVFSDLNDLVAVLNDSPEERECIKGELVETMRPLGGFGALITHTLSSYYPLKQANDECQNLLELLVSPIVAMNFDRVANDRDFLKQAWKLLIQNQAHDSICGCSIDQVHKDMEYRFDQVKEISKAIIGEFLVQDRCNYTGVDIRDECRHIGGGEPEVTIENSDGSLAVRVFNSLPYQLDNVIDFTIDFPIDFPTTYEEPFGYQTVNSFELLSESGEKIPYGITKITRNYTKRLYRYSCIASNRYQISAKVCLKPFGWTTLKVQPVEKPVRCFASQLTGMRSAENKYLKLDIHSDGTFSVTDKRNGKAYNELNNFIHDSEIGDGWNHVTPKGTSLCVSAGENVAVKLVEDSPQRTVFAITRQMTVPARLEYSGNLAEQFAGVSQSNEQKTLEITTQITLDADSILLKLNTSLNNTARDYRLRLALPTGIDGNYFAYQSFCFLDRASGRATGDITSDWKEPEQLEKNFNGIAGKRDEQGGIAFFSRAGLHEVGTSNTQPENMYITFLRAIRRTASLNGGERCQLSGEISWDYGLYLLDNADNDSSIYNTYQEYCNTLPVHTLPFNPDYPMQETSLIEFEDKNICLSIIKHSVENTQKEAVVRLFNPEQEAKDISLKFSREITACNIVNLNEENIKSLESENNSVTIKINQQEIVTIKIKFK